MAKTKMSTQTKCTISLCCLFIIEIFPLPFTALISLYVIRRRPKWFPDVVERLYADKPVEPATIFTEESLRTRKKCTMVLTAMTIVDLLIPVTIPTGLYIIRRRPKWFNHTAKRLYADQSHQQQISINYPIEISESLGQLDARPEVAAAQLKRHLELERKNLNYAKSTAIRNSLKVKQRISQPSN